MGISSLKCIQVKLIGVIVIMKTEKVRYFTLLLLLALSVGCAPMDSLTSVQDIEARYAAQSNGSEFDHEALAKEYEDLAKEMQVRAQEQEEMLEHKTRSSIFGKNGRDIKSHVAYKVGRYEQIAQDSIEKATYHRKIAAEQMHQNSIAKIEQK